MNNFTLITAWYYFLDKCAGIQTSVNTTTEPRVLKAHAQIPFVISIYFHAELFYFRVFAVPFHVNAFLPTRHHFTLLLYTLLHPPVCPAILHFFSLFVVVILPLSKLLSCRQCFLFTSLVLVL